MYQGASTLQHPQMASIVYMPTSEPSSIAYYASESAINPQSMQQLPQHQVSLVYSDKVPQQHVHALQQIVLPESYATEATPFYAYQPPPHETNGSTSNLVCFVPTVSTSNAPQLSRLIQPLGYNSISLHADPCLRSQETNATPQVMQQVLTADYAQHPMKTAAPPSKTTSDSAGKTNVTTPSEVCRHYLNGRCNRRKCRFLHPEVCSPSVPSHVTYTPCDPTPIMKTPLLAQVSPLTPYSSLSTASLNSFSVPSSTPWEAIL
ncbi:hypothetical protein, conserved [Leishmania tarentolae]|uniref:C3H1-type domain-containing protein n=1 Tax=Leishmania tarentolae TaxID=5689 RepID=A0A640KTN7_LEITA|nr:hypothetical protein, conserved [Leishmania tarentolae]